MITQHRLKELMIIIKTDLQNTLVYIMNNSLKNNLRNGVRENKTIENILKIAKDVVDNTKKYLIEQGIALDKIEITEVNNWFNPKINNNGVFVTEAFKIKIK